MPCSRPIHGYRAINGKVVPTRRQSHTATKITVPCGHCLSCRLNRSRQWAIRLIKEATYHEPENISFITLTYNDENLPKNGSIDVKHFQKFMKDLRYAYSNYDGKNTRRYPKIKYFHCGEYGETCANCGGSAYQHEQDKISKKPKSCDSFRAQLGRPHYHAILYGVPFHDKKLFKKTKSGSLIYTSETLEKVWGRGHTSIGEVTYQSCAYVARYIMKKITGDLADDHYQKNVFNRTTGEIERHSVEPEYITMSRNPAIAKEYFRDNLKDIAKNDGVLLNRKGSAYLTQPPRYYMKQLEELDKETFDTIKERRRLAQQRNKETQERLEVIEEIKRLKIGTLTRNIEELTNE